MRLSDFEQLIRRMCDDVPPEFLEGVAEVTVSPRTVPHPTRADIYTLGECIPLPTNDTIQSRVVLYHGSFAALARLQHHFDWQEEAWETLTHELRHHLEWRAHAPALEALDRAVEQNFARQEGEPFDPTFYLDGEAVADAVYRVEDDYFLDRVVGALPPDVVFVWHGTEYRLVVPAGATLPAYLTVEQIADPPPGDVTVVLRRAPGLRSLFQGEQVFQATVRAECQV